MTRAGDFVGASNVQDVDVGIVLVLENGSDGIQAVQLKVLRARRIIGRQRRNRHYGDIGRVIVVRAR